MVRALVYRSGIAAVVAWSLTAALHSASARTAAEIPDRIPATAVAAVSDVGLTVDDLDRSVSFFTNVLGFEKVSEVEVAGPEWEKLTGVFGARARIATLRLGEETIELTDYLTPRGQPFPYDTRANDVWFQHIAIVVSDMDAAYARLRAAGIEHASTGPQRLPDSIPSAAGIRAFYFRDPDGHFLELLEFPAGKGDARWHAGETGTNAPLFLGIDHTAIVVRDTDRALAFYRDRLGFRVTGTSENYGTEQEHLNNVEHARLRITTLRAAHGPGIELLEYLAPSGGRTSSQPIRANDLAYWQTRLVVDTSADARCGGIAHCNPDSSARFRGGTAVVVRDTDGHALELLSNR
ncbi:MAG TPA: VOC family protein [Candidatus Limnocylindrales bacterium]|nr:VOC family protein [Candidatus Limnocylindrales bacterium]